MLVIFSVSGYVVALNSVSKTQKNLTEQAIAFTKLSTKPLAEAKELYFDSGYFKFKEVFSEIQKLDPSIKKIQFIDVNGKIIFDSDKIGESSYEGSDNNFVDQATLEKVISAEPEYVYNPKNSSELTEIFYPYFSNWGSHPYTLRYLISYDEIKANIITVVEQTILLFIIFFIFVVLAITTSVGRLILSPITQLNRLTEKISAGKYGERIQLKTGDEIENLADSTNKMAEKLEQDIIDLQELDKLKDEFIDIAAHNFRTPVTHIRFDLDFLKTKLTGKIGTKELDVIKDINSSNESLTLLIDDLLNITTLEKEKMKLVKFQPFDLVTTIKEAADIYGRNAQKKNITFKVDISKNTKAEVLGDPPKVREVIGNIVENAFKFTKEKGSVWIQLEESPKEYIVTIKDTGIGISKEEIPKIFNKFHRATDILTYDYEGRGLGLYISKLIVEAHNGHIWVESKIDKGSKFSFSLPKNLPNSPIPQHV